MGGDILSQTEFSASSKVTESIPQIDRHPASEIIETIPHVGSSMSLFRTLLIPFSVLVIILMIIFKKYIHVVIGATILSSLTVIGSLLTVEEFNLDEFVVIKRNIIENQSFNIYKNNEVVESNEIVSDLKLIDSVIGFESGSYASPNHDWNELERKIIESEAKFIVLSGFNDPHKMKSDSDFTNADLAKDRATEVKDKIESMGFFKNSNIEVFIIYGGINNGVKLLDYQIEMYSSERKVEIYVGA
jgi:hypothetical protein